MHELSIAQGLLDVVLAEAGKVHARKVLRVSLKIGDLAGVVPDSLSFCFDLLSKSTIAEGATLTIERIPIKGYCPLCKNEFIIADNRYLCRKCGNKRIELTSGRELQIGSLEVEDETD